MINRRVPINRIGLRPYLSDKGPQIKELVLTKIKNIQRDAVTSGTEQFNSSLIVGSAGRYRSVDSGGNDAIIATKTIIMKLESCFESAFVFSGVIFSVTDFLSSIIKYFLRPAFF